MAASPPVCRHFVAGSCRRSDCAFSHALGPCRFFFGATGCMKGTECPFDHDGRTLVEQPAAAAPQQPADAHVVRDARGPVFIASSPALLAEGSSSGSSSKPSAPALWGGSGAAAASTGTPVMSLASRVALSTLAAAYPRVVEAALASAYMEAKGDVKAAMAALASRYGPPVEKPSKKDSSGGGAGGSGKHTSSSRSTPTPHSAPPSLACSAAARVIARGLKPLVTGAEVAALYADARAKAEAVARARNAAYDAATEAYRAGHGATAAALSKRGRALHEHMLALHASAASGIFHARNTADGSRRSGGGREDEGEGLSLPPAVLVASGAGSGVPYAVRMFDLHGLHAGEAGELVTALVALEAARRSSDSSSIGREGEGVWHAYVTGTGSHSLSRGVSGGLGDAVGAALGAALPPLIATGAAVGWGEGAGVYVARFKA